MNINGCTWSCWRTTYRWANTDIPIGLTGTKYNVNNGERNLRYGWSELPVGNVFILWVVGYFYMVSKNGLCWKSDRVNVQLWYGNVMIYTLLWLCFNVIYVPAYGCLLFIRLTIQCLYGNSTVQNMGYLSGYEYNGRLVFWSSGTHSH